MNEAVRFMRIPYFVAGHQVTLENMEIIAAWCNGKVIRDDADDPFVRVPVYRTIRKSHTEAHVGSWVIVSEVAGSRPAFKVYADDWMTGKFWRLPDGSLAAFDLAQLPGQTPHIPMQSAPAQQNACGGHHCCGCPPVPNLRSVPTQTASNVTPLRTGNVNSTTI